MSQGGRDTRAESQAAFLVAVVLNGSDIETCEEHLDELTLLARTAGYHTVGRLIQDRARPEAATLLGRGKVEELARRVKETGACQVITDDDLSPQQAVNLEKRCGVPVTDRSGLILQIFASRARTREARTQVEVASLRYTLPRLTRRWTHLSRQDGRLGARAGVGETQIELDRRMIRRRIARLEKELDTIGKRRRVRRQRGRNVFTAALVGYTNSGKSTLFNALTRATCQVEDRLFATLDPVRRRLAGTDGQLVMTDTVGFIRKLPHHLVASFRSTLEEAGEADLLVQVVDISDPHLDEKMATTTSVLDELGLADRRMLRVFNKTDCMNGSPVPTRLARLYPDALFLSAQTGDGIDALIARLHQERARTEVEEEISIASHDSSALNVLHRHGRVVDVSGDGDQLLVTVRTSRAGVGRIRRRLQQGGA